MPNSVTKTPPEELSLQSRDSPSFKQMGWVGVAWRGRGLVDVRTYVRTYLSLLVDKRPKVQCTKVRPPQPPRPRATTTTTNPESLPMEAFCIDALN